MATEVETEAKIAAGRKVITGNYAVSYGAALARAQVISAYPITPQTTIVELLADFCAEGMLNAKFIKVESEHSAMASCIGASAAGARAFTATSAQGLALMHEVLHWAAGARLPIVLAEVNRAMAPPGRSGPTRTTRSPSGTPAGSNTTVSRTRRRSIRSSRPIRSPSRFHYRRCSSWMPSSYPIRASQ